MCILVSHQLCVAVGRSPFSDVRNPHSRQFVVVKPFHSAVDSRLDLVTWMIQAHQQTHQSGTLRTAERSQLEGSCFCRLQRFPIVLLTPHRRFTVASYLCSENTIDTFVESHFHFLAHLLCDEFSLIGLLLFHHVFQHQHGVFHGMVVIGDMNLIVAHYRPKLRPSAVGILPAEQIIHPFAERIFISFILRLLVESCQENHLCGRGIIVGSRVVAS